MKKIIGVKRIREDSFQATMATLAKESNCVGLSFLWLLDQLPENSNELKAQVKKIQDKHVQNFQVAVPLSILKEYNVSQVLHKIYDLDDIIPLFKTESKALLFYGVKNDAHVIGLKKGDGWMDCFDTNEIEQDKTGCFREDMNVFKLMLAETFLNLTKKFGEISIWLGFYKHYAY